MLSKQKYFIFRIAAIIMSRVENHYQNKESDSAFTSIFGQTSVLISVEENDLMRACVDLRRVPVVLREGLCQYMKGFCRPEEGLCRP